jgi:hypothetical protein
MSGPRSDPLVLKPLKHGMMESQMKIDTKVVQMVVSLGKPWKRTVLNKLGPRCRANVYLQTQNSIAFNAGDRVILI